MRPLRTRHPSRVSGTFVVLLVSLAAGPFAPAPAKASFLTRDVKSLTSRRTADILAGAAVLGAASLLVENPDAEEHALGRGAVDAPADVGNIYGSGLVLAGVTLGLTGAGLVDKDPDWVRAGSEMARSLAYAGIAVTALKVAVRRTRPNGGAYSFPSGHTAAAFAVAPVLARRFGWLAALPAYALATSTALGRMEDRKHYLSDVVVGAGIGTAIGLAVASERQPSAAEPETVKRSLGLGIAPAGLSLVAKF